MMSLMTSCDVNFDLLNTVKLELLLKLELQRSIDQLID